MLLAACAAVAVFALTARLHDVRAYPPMYDYDASSHAVNVVDLLEGRLPDLRSWGGSHAPLYYMVGAAACAVLPDTVPMHVTLRMLSVIAWIATVVVVWRTLRRVVGTSDAAVVAALLLGVPGIVIVTCMMTNDALVAFFVTATLARLVGAGDAPSLRHVVPTAALAGLAALTKTTGVAAIGVAAAFYAWRARRRLARALGHVVVFGLIVTVIAGPHYARLFASLSGRTYAIVGARAGSREKVAIERIVDAAASLKSRYPSLTRLVHASVWGDPAVAYLPPNTAAGATLSAAGVLVALVGLGGVLRLALRRDLVAASGAALAFAPLYVAALVPVILLAPYLVLTKVNYFLPLALPVATAVAAGAGGLGAAGRTTVRGMLLVTAVAGVALTWYGWWMPPHAESAAVVRAPAPVDPPSVVARYFAERASDPIRALTRLAPEQQLAHELRLVRILRVPYTPDVGLAPGEERSLELARARTAWLELYNLVRWMQPIAAALDVAVLTTRPVGDGAEVRVRVAAAGAAPPPAAVGMGPWPFRPFEQRVTLARAGGGWRITRVTQDGVGDDNAVAAFVAEPTLAAFDHLRALGWKPTWEDAIAAAVRAGA